MRVLFVSLAAVVLALPGFVLPQPASARTAGALARPMTSYTFYWNPKFVHASDPSSNASSTLFYTAGQVQPLLRGGSCTTGSKPLATLTLQNTGTDGSIAWSQYGITILGPAPFKCTFKAINALERNAQTATLTILARR